jgi:hypothetical protein
MRPSGASPERTGVVVVRPWIEAGGVPPSGVRIRITATPDVSVPESRTVVVATVEDALAVVRWFLEEFVGDVTAR